MERFFTALLERNDRTINQVVECRDNFISYRSLIDYILKLPPSQQKLIRFKVDNIEKSNGNVMAYINRLISMLVDAHDKSLLNSEKGFVNNSNLKAK